MFIKNNSKNEWLQYNVGRGLLVDIKPESIFEVPDWAGKKLIQLLGSEKWLTKVEKPEPELKPKVEKKELKPKVEKKTKKKK